MSLPGLESIPLIQTKLHRPRLGEAGFTSFDDYRNAYPELADHLYQMQLLQLNEAQQIPRETQIEWLRHVVQSAFAGRRVVIFYGGAKNDDENAIFEADRAIRDGGGFVSIIGRNVFQRETADALLLESMMNIYAEGGERQEIID